MSPSLNHSRAEEILIGEVAPRWTGVVVGSPTVGRPGGVRTRRRPALRRVPPHLVEDVRAEHEPDDRLRALELARPLTTEAVSRSPAVSILAAISAHTDPVHAEPEVRDELACVRRVEPHERSVERGVGGGELPVAGAVRDGPDVAAPPRLRLQRLVGVRRRARGHVGRRTARPCQRDAARGLGARGQVVVRPHEVTVPVLRDEPPVLVLEKHARAQPVAVGIADTVRGAGVHELAVELVAVAG